MTRPPLVNKKRERDVSGDDEFGVDRVLLRA
jgi:hypothetical protein